MRSTHKPDGDGRTNAAPSPAETKALVPLTANEEQPNELRTRVVRAFGWNMTSQGVRQVTRIVYGIAIARLITPREYGLAGMALVFASLGVVFSDLGFGAALVQRQRITQRDRTTVFWTTVAVGLLMSIGGFTLAGPIAHFYGQPHVKPLFQVLSIIFLITALGMTQAAILQRELDFRTLELRIMAGVVVGAATAVGLAAAGFGAWALIANELTVAGISTALMWLLSSWRPGGRISVETVRDFVPFSAHLVGKSAVDYLGRNSDNILVGRFLGSAPLGAYSVAYNIMLLPIRNLVQPIQETLFPALSRMQEEPRRIAAIWLRATRLVAVLIVPAMLGLVVVAPDFVPVVLGGKWRPAVPIVQILAVVAILQAVTLLGLKVLTALGQTRKLFRFSLVFNVASLAAFGLGLHWGITGVATCYAIINVPFQWAFARMTARAVQIPMRSFTGALSGVIAASIGMTAFVEAARLVLVHQGVAATPRLCITIATGMLTYVPLCVSYVPEVRSELQLVGRSRRKDAASQVVSKPA